MPQNFVGSPVFRKLDNGSRQVPVVLSSLASKRAKRENASAVEPANPATTRSLKSRRSFFAEAFRTSEPIVTWPSPAITTLPLRRTQRMVVEPIRRLEEAAG